MASLSEEPPQQTTPSFIPPRTSSHGVGTTPASPPRASILGNKSAGKRPISHSSENWAAQSSEKKVVLVADPLTTPNSSPSAARRPKSEHLEDRIAGTALAFGPKPVLVMSPGKPPREPASTLGDDLIHSQQPPWSNDKEKILLGPYDFLFGHPGKDIRAQLIAAFNEWLKVPEDRLAIITKVVGMLHTSSLLVDDVEDSSILRRGAPVAHNIFGVPQVINSANYVYFLALEALTTLQNPRILQIFTEELINLHRGQGMDLFWRDTLTCPTEADYLEMVHNKTGGLFRLAIKLMQAESTTINAAAAAAATAAATVVEPGPNAVEASSSTSHAAPLSCIPLINTIGLQFQILDDLLNLSSAEYTSRKGLAEDLTEGKFSFPVIHAIRANPSNLVLLNVLRQKTTDEEVKRYAIQYMESVGSFDYTRRVVSDLEAKAIREVERLEGVFPEGKRGAELIKGILGKLRAL